MIYFDNAATTMVKPQAVTDAVVQAMNSMGNAGRGSNSASLDAARVVYQARERLARFFNAEDARQIAFTANSTESLNIAVKGVLEPGDHVITTVLEHNSVLRPLYQMQERGVKLTILPADAKGNISYSELEDAIMPETKAIITTHASNLTGNILDVRRIGEIARRNQVLYIVDASQTAGVIPIDVQGMGIDILCFTGHKSLFGPQGTGGLYVKPGLHLEPLITGGTGIQTFSKKQPAEMPTALEAGTLNGHGIAGLNAGAAFIEETGIDAIRAKELKHMRKFYDAIREIPGIRIYGDFDSRERCPIVTFNFQDYGSGEVSDELLTDYGIVTRSGGHGAPLMHESFGTMDQGAVRFSFSYFNTDAEVDLAIKAMREITT